MHRAGLGHRSVFPVISHLAGIRRAVVLACVVFCVVAAVALTIALIWPVTDLVAAHDVGTMSGAARALHLQEAREAVRTQLLTVGAGLVATAALVYTALNFRLSRRGQVTDRYTKAIEQLGSEKLDVRLGGIYALEYVARDSRIDHPIVMEVLAAFIREHSHEPWPLKGGDSEVPKRATRPDVQAAVTVIGRRNSRYDPRGMALFCDLNGADLTEANLALGNFAHATMYNVSFTRARFTEANLAGAALNHATFRGAYAVGANLSGAILSGASVLAADLDGANLYRARLTGADLSDTTFIDANLSEANLTDANLTNANFTQASLLRANLVGAKLCGAKMSRTKIRGANLAGADLAGARFLGADLSGAWLLAATVTTADFTGADLTGAAWPVDAPEPAGWVRSAKTHGELKRLKCPPDLR